MTTENTGRICYCDRPSKSGTQPAPLGKLGRVFDIAGMLVDGLP